ncbi:hypothetical protein SAMN04488066_12520 [Halorubrum aquaticum]|uniref:Uncharacterized protein n=1 Tax=Halorubrum aquaticum TaxID=387340 RepID=A0A1I3CMT8_9EURY|nr:hypothetical protein [Halorubrum aquaticum]SFH75832.1 hypothetical protein SAMN04488066_12520 [Halorubrum aquaticum]
MTARNDRDALGRDGPDRDGPDDEPPPGPVEEPVPDPEAVLGRVPTGTSLRRELAAAARSRGRTSSLADEIAAIHGELTAIEVPDVDLESARRRLADATGAEGRLEERVAAIRGDVRARRAVDADPAKALADLEAAAAELSEAQTARIAAEQTLERERERAAAARDEREHRLALRDRLENRKRDARQELSLAVYAEFRESLSAVPGGDPVVAGTPPSEYDGSPLAASLGAIRIAEIEGPVTLRPGVASVSDAWEGTDPEAVLDVPVTGPDL